jgi:acetylornithine deacetylase/succinyl-diaminopimelate desuccinylase-like protein
MRSPAPRLVVDDATVAASTGGRHPYLQGAIGTDAHPSESLNASPLLPGHRDKALSALNTLLYEHGNPAQDYTGKGNADPNSTATSGYPRSNSSGFHAMDLSQQALLQTLDDLVSIPSVSPPVAPGHGLPTAAAGPSGAASGPLSRQSRNGPACWTAARYVHDLLAMLGAECKLIQGAAENNPVVLARLGGWNAACPCIVLHAHYDVQPPGDLANWHTDPFSLVGLDGYLYGRGSTDNKGPLVAMIFAVARYLRHIQTERPVGTPELCFAFIIEGEGENGSVGFREVVTHAKEFFRGASLIVSSNNLWLGESVPCLTYGMRGMVKVRVDVEGPSTDLHSGLDGGVSHEPLQDLCALVGNLQDPLTGRINVLELYDQVAALSVDELKLYRDLHFNPDEYLTSRGIRGAFASSNLRIATRHMDGCCDAHGEEMGAAATPIVSAPDLSTKGSLAARENAPVSSMASASADASANRINVGVGASLRPERSASFDNFPPESLSLPTPRVVLQAGQGAGTASDEQIAVTARRVASAATSSSSGTPTAAAAAENLLDIEVPAAILLRRWREPALTLHSINNASASNDSIIPYKASALVSLRTVPDMTSTGTFSLLAEHLKRCFLQRQSVNRLTIQLVSHASWWLQKPTSWHYEAAARAVERHWGRPPVFVREGGTVRVTTFLEKTLGAPALHLPMGQSSDSPHLPNERIRLLNLLMGCRVLESLFFEVAQQREDHRLDPEPTAGDYATS